MIGGKSVIGKEKQFRIGNGQIFPKRVIHKGHRHWVETRRSPEQISIEYDFKKEPRAATSVNNGESCDRFAQTFRL